MTRRPRRTSQQWQGIMQRQADSGLPTREYCNANDLNYAVFCKWRNKLARTQAPLIELKPPVMQAMAQQLPVWDIELELGDGATLRLRRS